MNKGINIGFRPVVNGTEKDLMRQVTFFESNTDTAFKAVEQQAQPKGVPTNLQLAAYQAQEEDIIPCAGTFTVTLPTANSQNAGRRIAVIVRSGTITVNALSGQVQGASSDSLASVGLYEYLSDGIGWWRR